MKRLFAVLIPLGIIIVGSTVYGVMGNDANNDSSIVNIEALNESHEQLQQFPESEILMKKGYTNFSMEVGEESPYKRVILYQDGKEQLAKSIYIKKTNRLKIVEYGRGIVFNEII